MAAVSGPHWRLSIAPSPFWLDSRVATEPWAPINPLMPACGWYGDQTGHGESSDSWVKGGIDFLIRSSKQIELQLNLKPWPPPTGLSSWLRTHLEVGDRGGRMASFSAFFPVFLAVCFHCPFISLSHFSLTSLPSVTLLMVFVTKAALRCTL